MCDDGQDLKGVDTHHGHKVGPARFGRRALLAGAAALGAGATVAGRASAAAGAPLPASSRRPNSAGESWWRMASHLHGSFSEGYASWRQHLDQASRNGFDVVVPTDHDWRVMLRHYSQQFHFAGWQQSTPSGSWSLSQTAATVNLAATSSGTIVPSPSPLDATPGAGALRLAVQSKNGNGARLTYSLSDLDSNSDFTGTVLGRRLRVQVLATSAGSAASCPALQVMLSNDPVWGRKSITYRLRTDLPAGAGALVAGVVGGAATIDLPVVRGRWSEVVPDLLTDIATCWPTLDAADCGLQLVMFVGYGTKAAPLEALFSALRFDPDPSYDAAASYDAVVAAAAARYPGLLTLGGLEHSVDAHFGQIGGRRFFYPYPQGGPGTHSAFGDAVAFDQVAQILDHGGVATYNHPFGVGTAVPRGPARTAALTSVIASVLRTGAYGADVLEVGYAARGMDLAGHLELFDACSANGLHLTATGVSDDHVGTSWATQRNRFATLPWSTLDEPSLQAALRTGRVSVAQLGSLDGALDLSLNGRARMGQVLSAAQTPDDALLVECSGAPAGSTLRVKWGPVDHGGTAYTRAVTLTDLPASSLAAGAVPVPLSTAPDGYYRTELLDPTGATIAFSNPVWRVAPGATAPADRLVVG